jgi:hypothetical protein
MAKLGLDDDVIIARIKHGVCDLRFRIPTNCSTNPLRSHSHPVYCLSTYLTLSDNQGESYRVIHWLLFQEDDVTNRIVVMIAAILLACGTAHATSDLGAQINAAIAALPSTGGVVDSCAMTGGTTYISPIVINKPVTLKVCVILTANTGSNSGVLITSSGVRITGSSPDMAGFAQSAAGMNLVQFDGTVDDISIDHLLFKGVNTTSCFSGVLDNGIFAETFNISRLRILNNVFTNLCGNGIFIERAGDLMIRGNIMYGLNSAGIRVAGVQRTKIVDNNIGPTNLVSSQFNVALALDDISEGCPGCTNSLDVAIVGNTIVSYPDAQGILIHDGTRVSVADNVVRDVLDGIGVSTFAAPDSINDVTITGNVLSGTNIAGASSGTSQIGITVTGDPTHPVAKINIVGNNILNFNAISQVSNYGGVSTSNSDSVSIIANNIYNNYYQAIIIGSYATRVNIRANNIYDTVSVSGHSYGVRVSGGQAISTISGSIASNSVDNVSVCNEFDSSEQGILFSNATNDCTRSGTYIVGSSNVTVK